MHHCSVQEQAVPSWYVVELEDKDIVAVGNSGLSCSRFGSMRLQE